MMSPRFIAIVLFSLCLAPAPGRGRDFTVASGGTGDFKTVQAAVDAVPENNRERVVISIRNGTYAEQVRINKSFLTFRGEDRKKTRIVLEVDSNACTAKGSVQENCATVLARANDLVFENLTVENPYKGPRKGAALSVSGTSTRIVVSHVDVVGYGGDTFVLSSRGQYYLNNVYVSGTYHIIVPRGATYATNCTFRCLGNRICLFNEGISGEAEKMVIRDSTIDGPAPFGLGSYFRDAAWYFIDDTFSDKLRPEGQIFRNPAANYQVKWGEDRIYFAGSKGPDYPWLKDNLDRSPAKSREVITAAWTLPEWNPESAVGPLIRKVEAAGEEIRLVFSESVTVRGGPVLKLRSGTAVYTGGSGSDTLVFRGKGTPVGVEGGAIFASKASFKARPAALQLPR